MWALRVAVGNISPRHVRSEVRRSLANLLGDALPSQSNQTERESQGHVKCASHVGVVGEQTAQPHFADRVILANQTIRRVPSSDEKVDVESI
jgi:hypothetical protein